MITDEQRKLAEKRDIPPLPGPYSKGHFGSVELSRIFAVLYPEIDEKSNDEIDMLNGIMHSLFTGKQEGLLRAIEILTSPEMREHMEEILAMIDEDQAEINDLKDIDVLLTKGKNEVLNTARKLDLEEKCGRLYALLEEDDDPT